LHRRGFKVFVYWMLERNEELVDNGITQRVLCNAMRWQFRRPSAAMDLLGRSMNRLPAYMRRNSFRLFPTFWLDMLMSNFISALCAGIEKDRGLISRLEKFIARDGVTHLLPTFAMICPIAQAAKARGKVSFNYLATFQGEEVFANYAHRIGKTPQYHQLLRHTVAASGWPAVAVSHDYIQRLRDEMGIDQSRLRVIYPGIEWPPEDAPPPPMLFLQKRFPSIDPRVPIVTYIGRQDAEKGIDLLLYAVRMLLDEGVKLQLIICGGSSFGQHYPLAIRQIAEHLRVPILHRGRISGDLRDAIYHHSRCIVYPSIHREPFGMVAAEAMSRGTPVLVPDLGGITEAIQWEGRAGGLTFRAWDSADLARQLKRLVTDNALHRELASCARPIASNFTVERITDHVLEHLGITQQSTVAVT
jgi:glycosyltransferase involved in cell wall biosynthesis